VQELFKEIGIPKMKRSRIVETQELEVPAADEIVLIFRLEISECGAGQSRRYSARLYRLENFRFRVRDESRGQSGKWMDADYRCWVLDENLAIDASSFPSLVKARNSAIKTLKTQLGI
jgi:hypothetical protein